MIIAKAIGRVADFIYKYAFFFLPDDHPWDYVAHFIVSFVVMLAISLFLKIVNVPPRISFYTAIGFILLLSIIKEVADIYLGKTDGLADMTANIIGVIAAALIILFVIKTAN